MVVAGYMYHFELGIGFVNVDHGFHILFVFIQTSILRFDYEVRTLDLRSQTQHDLLWVTVQRAHAMFQVPGELPLVIFFIANSFQSSL